MRPGPPRRKKKSPLQRTRRMKKGWLNRWRVGEAFMLVTITQCLRFIILVYSSGIRFLRRKMFNLCLEMSKNIGTVFFVKQLLSA
jgi:hypothetical protein